MAIFDGNNSQTPVGFATQVDPVNFPGLYTVHVHHGPGRRPAPHHGRGADGRSATVPARPIQTGFGDRSVSLDITVDTVVPPAYFGLLSQADTTQGLDGASDSGVLGDPNLPATFTDRVTNDKTPTLVRRRRGKRDRPHLSGHQRRAGAPDDRRQPRYVPGRDGGRAHGRHEPVPQRRVEIHRNPRPERSDVSDLGIDGLRTFFVTGEDLAGNVTAGRQRRLAANLPRHAGTADHQRADHRLAGVQPVRAETQQRLARPHPAGQFADDQRSGPAGAGGGIPLSALAADATSGYPATDPGNYLLVGDANGIIPITA